MAEDLCKYAENCKMYKETTKRNDDDAAAQIEVCTGATRFHQICYEKEEALEQTAQNSSEGIFNHGRMLA